MGALIHTPPDPDFERFMQEQKEEIESDFNRHVTREKFGREPTPYELAMNYIETGGAQRYAERHNRT